MQKQYPGDKEILDAIDKSFTQVDEQRLAELNNLKQVQEIKNEVYKLERSRLVNKYGEDHPRVQNTNSRLAYNQEMFSGLDKEIKRAEIKTEPLPINAWRVHGKVFDKNTPVTGMTVFLTDQKQNWVEVMGSDCTDEKGYYSITVDEKIVKQFARQPLFASVSDKNKKIIYRDTVRLFASEGLIDYKDIFLNDAASSCIPPPSNPVNPPKATGKSPKRPAAK